MENTVYVIYTTDEEKNTIILGYTKNIDTAELYVEKLQMNSNSRYGHFYMELDCYVPPYYARPSSIVCRVDVTIKNENREEYELEVIVDPRLNDIVDESDIIYNLYKNINQFYFRFRLDINETDSYDKIIKEATKLAHDKYRSMIKDNDKFIQNIDKFFNERQDYLNKLQESMKNVSDLIKSYD